MSAVCQIKFWLGHLVQNSKPSPSILICDPVLRDIRDTVAELKSAGYRLIMAYDGKDACDRATLLRPDIILLEVQLPLLDGLAACHLLKAHTDTSHIPIIFISAASSITDRLAGLRAGAVDYIAKPAHPQEVHLRVAAQLARNHSQQPKHSPIAAPLSPNRASQHALVHAFIHLLNHSADASAPVLDPTAADLTQINHLAARLGISRSTLDDAFHQILGASASGWLREQRLRRAGHWLTHSQLPIHQIALDLAYSNSANFATAFKARYGLSPRAWRQKTQNPQYPNANTAADQQATSTEPDLLPTANPWHLLAREGLL